jgi:hypothetical protein
MNNKDAEDNSNIEIRSPSFLKKKYPELSFKLSPPKKLV